MEFKRIAYVLCVVFGLLTISGVSVAGLPAGEQLPFDLRDQLSGALRKWIGEKADSKNADGVTNKRGTYSRDFRKAEDGTFLVTAHVDTAEATALVTERYLLTLGKSGTGWQVTGQELKDSYSGLRRGVFGPCRSFERFSFDREGLKMSASGGTLCVNYIEGKVGQFGLQSADMQYEYQPPEHSRLFISGHDFYAVHKLVAQDHARELKYSPTAFLFECDPTTCEALLDKHFTGLDLPDAPGEGGAVESASESAPAWQKELKEQARKALQENAFAGFRSPYTPDRRTFTAFIARDLQTPAYAPGSGLPGSGIALTYDNWEGYEVRFSVWPQRIDEAGDTQLISDIYGYYTEETLADNTPESLERRPDSDARWHEVTSVKGTVDMALEDPEILHGSIDFGISLRRTTRELPFSIQSIPRQGIAAAEKPRFLFVNSVQLDGQELTWVKTGPVSGLLILPETMPEGTELNLQMDFETRALRKVNYAYTQMSRFGWMPFVRFADFIDEFELTIRSPSQYTILGIGHKVEEHKEGDTLVSHWKSDSPVVFPTIMFGKYFSDKPQIKATKLDGTEIPVAVHVDEVSMHQLDIAVDSERKAEETFGSFDSGARGIRGKQLRPIAEQAVNAINLYREVSGIDYPYGELNLVNDPAPALYGQAPSSLIYLGSLVFRGEGTIAGGGLFGGGDGDTSTAKFLKSVVAHEVGHQWWGSRVSNANGRNYWFVETLAEYFSAIYLESRYGKKEYQQQVDEWRSNILDTEMKGSVQNAGALWTGENSDRAYQSAAYSKGPYAFHMMRATFGDEKFFPALKQLSQELTAKREIVTLDIQHAAEKALGGIDPDGNPYNVDLSWFFDQWIRGAGIPQYAFQHGVRETEDGEFIVEGVIKQRVVVGSSRSMQELPGQYYRGVVDITVKAKDKQYESRVVVEGPETSFRFKVPQKPIEVVLNENRGMLAHDVLTDKSW